MAGARSWQVPRWLGLLEQATDLGGRPPTAYGWAVALVALATAVRLPLEPLLQGAVPFATFLPAVVLSSLIGGAGPGVFALALTILVGWWLVLPLSSAQDADVASLWSDVPSVLLYAMSAGITILVVVVLREALATLRESEAQRRHAVEEEQRRLSLIIDNLSEAITAVFLDTGTTLRNRAWLRFHDIASFDELPGWRHEDVRKLFALYTADGRRIDPEDTPLQRALRGERFEDLEVRVHRLSDGRQWWGSYNGSVLRDRHGVVQAALISMRDITDRKRAEERQQLLIRELSHRVKNMLALISGIARQTGSRVERTADFLPAFEARLGALRAAHDLLTAAGWEGVLLPDLARTALGPHLGRIRIDLPPVKLPPALAQTLALVLHELATNASKYGALSRSEGRVTFIGAADRHEVVLDWREEGGPPVTAPPTRAGFGTTLVTQGVRHQHHGKVEVDWRPEGLSCRFILPLGDG